MTLSVYIELKKDNIYVHCFVARCNLSFACFAWETLFLVIKIRRNSKGQTEIKIKGNIHSVLLSSFFLRQCPYCYLLLLCRWGTADTEGRLGTHSTPHSTPPPHPLPQPPPHTHFIKPLWEALAQEQRSQAPTSACGVFSCFCNPSNSDVDCS